MLDYKEIMEARDREVVKLREQATSARLPSLGDHDYIVGVIDGLTTKLNDIVTSLLNKHKEEEDEFNAADIDEDPHGEFGAKIRPNRRRGVSPY